MLILCHGTLVDFIWDFTETKTYYNFPKLSGHAFWIWLMKKHFIDGTLVDFTWDLSKISMSDSHVSYANFDIWVIILNVWKVLIKILEGTFCQTPLWLNLSSKFSIWCDTHWTEYLLFSHSFIFTCSICVIITRGVGHRFLFSLFGQNR